MVTILEFQEENLAAFFAGKWVEWGFINTDRGLSLHIKCSCGLMYLPLSDIICMSADDQAICISCASGSVIYINKPICSCIL